MPDQQPDASPAPVGGTDLVRGGFGGVLMGLANLVPGISGGTMLLAAGVYPQFINGIAEVSTFRLRLSTLLMLASIVGAAVLAIGLFAGLMGELVVHHRWVMYSVFIGLTLGGVPVIWPMIRPLGPAAVLGVLSGVAVMAVMAFIGPAGGPDASDSHPYLLYLLAGLAAASAMVLPGVSGGYLLLLLGQYVTIVLAVDMFKDGLVDRDRAQLVESLHVIAPVGVGVLIGVVGVSNLVKFLLQRFERPTLGVLLGLLLGAVLGLWPFQHGVAPEVGTAFKGDTVVERDGQLTLERADKIIEPQDYPTAFFRPQPLQVAAAVGLALAGFAAAVGIARVGRGDRPQLPRT